MWVHVNLVYAPNHCFGVFNSTQLYGWIKLLNVVCFKWEAGGGVPDYKRYSAGHVNAFQRMLETNLSRSFQVHCITDNESGLDSGINAVELPRAFRALPEEFPKIMLFSDEMREAIGERFLYMDLDVVVTGNIDYIVPSPVIDFKVLAKRFKPSVLQCLKSKKHRRQRAFYNKGVKFNTSMMFSKAGARSNVYDHFDKKRAKEIQRYYMVPGSDQTWVYYCLGADEPTWTKEDGIFSYGSELKGKEKREVSSRAKLVFFGGDKKPWDKRVLEMSPWIRDHYPVELL